MLLSTEETFTSSSSYWRPSSSTRCLIGNSWPWTPQQPKSNICLMSDAGWASQPRFRPVLADVSKREYVLLPSDRAIETHVLISEMLLLISGLVLGNLLTFLSLEPTLLVNTMSVAQADPPTRRILNKRVDELKAGHHSGKAQKFDLPPSSVSKLSQCQSRQVQTLRQ
jgi:hypothetical protein